MSSKTVSQFFTALMKLVGRHSIMRATRITSIVSRSSCGGLIRIKRIRGTKVYIYIWINIYIYINRFLSMKVYVCMHSSLDSIKWSTYESVDFDLCILVCALLVDQFLNINIINFDQSCSIYTYHINTTHNYRGTLECVSTTFLWIIYIYIYIYIALLSEWGSPVSMVQPEYDLIYIILLLNKWFDCIYPYLYQYIYRYMSIYIHSWTSVLQDLVDANGDTLLHSATSGGALHVMQLLLELGADTEAVNYAGYDCI
jgi:hypothetical protein